MRDNSVSSFISWFCAAFRYLSISSTVNGELRQNSNTKYLLHSISEIIAELSQGMTLLAGTIIATGTPAGVGMGFNPPKFLKSGDVVTCEIEKIGRLTNMVLSHHGHAWR